VRDMKEHGGVGRAGCDLVVEGPFVHCHTILLPR
jgi:hypothetical protein